MSGMRKVGTRSHVLAVPTAAAGTAADASAIFTYQAYAYGKAITSSAGLDGAVEWVHEVVVTPDAAHTGQATNFSSIVVYHRGSTGTVKNQLQVDFSAAGATMTAWSPMGLTVASGATVANAGTATLSVPVGVALPWALAPGDTVSVKRLSTGTGNASPSLSATIQVGTKA